MCASGSKKTLQRIAATTALSTMMLTTAMPQFTSAASPPPALIDSTSDPEHALVDEAWRIINNYFYSSDVHDTNWQDVRETLRRTPLPNRIATYAALRRSLHKLDDRYTRVLTPKDMLALRKYDVSGVGLLITASEDDGDLVVVTEPAADTSAGKAGIKRGDVVLEIDGRDVHSVNPFTVAEWMQGADGSTMRVRFQNAGEVTLVRHFGDSGGDGGVGGNSVKRVAVAERGGERMGYVRLAGFEASSRLEVAHALKELREKGADWVVLDLRSNGGGVFEGALEIAGLFEGNGVPIVNVKGRQKDNQSQDLHEQYLSRVIDNEDVDWLDSDVGILMNGRSASSSEVLAGGLRDNCKAALIGRQSFGKGLIQGVFGLSDGGGIVVTVAEYRTPSGAKINGVGLKSDLKLRRPLLDELLGVFGIERMTEDSFIVSHDDVKDAMRLCREAKSGKFH